MAAAAAVAAAAVTCCGTSEAECSIKTGREDQDGRSGEHTGPRKGSGEDGAGLARMSGADRVSRKKTCGPQQVNHLLNLLDLQWRRQFPKRAGQRRRRARSSRSHRRRQHGRSGQSQALFRASLRARMQVLPIPGLISPIHFPEGPPAFRGVRPDLMVQSILTLLIREILLILLAISAIAALIKI